MSKDELDDKKGNDAPANQLSLLTLIRSLWGRFHSHQILWDVAVEVSLALYFAYYYSEFDRQLHTIYILIGDGIPNAVNTAKDPGKMSRLLGYAQRLSFCAKWKLKTEIPVKTSHHKGDKHANNKRNGKWAM
jgi:hypothetical protein